MASVRFVDVPHEEKDGLPQLFQLDPSTYGRTPSNLLDEAVRFYNYPADGHYASVNAWQVFRKDHVNKAILSLHDVLKKGIVTMIRNLYKDIPGHLDKKKCGKLHGYHSELGPMCAELLVSPKCRSQEKLKLLERSPSKVHFREFERLMASLGLLRTWAERIENIYQERYSNLIGGSESEIRQALFEPAWGGSWIVKPNKYIWKTRDRIWNPENPIWPYAPGDVGPTEKLYFTLTSDVFKKLHNVPFYRSKGHFSRTNDVFLQRVYQQSKIISQIMPPCNPKNKRIIIWKTWQRNLEHLAYIFEKAISEPWADKIEEAWLERKGEAWITLEKEKTDKCNIRLGFPAALGLIGILYAYITNLMARTLMVALSSAIIDIYEDISGYTAVGLYEALSGKDAIGPETVLDKELIGALRQWRIVPVAGVKGVSPWGDTEAEKWARNCFDELLKRPLISTDRWENHTPAYKKQKGAIGNGVSFDEFYKSYIPHFPVIRKEFYENLPLPKEEIHKEKGFDIDNWYADEKLYGATFESQVHIFVAFQLLEKSKEILKWNWESEKYRYEEGYEQDKKGRKKKIRKKKRYPTFFITAGSFIFGGRKQPHITHRHGVNFDFIFGPNLIPWPKSKVSDLIVKLKRNKKGKEWLKKFVATNKRKEFLRRTWRLRCHVICYTKEQEKKEEAARVNRNRPRMVFRSLVRDELVNVLIKRVREYCASKSGVAPYYSEQEKREYIDAESKLAGTPHFIRPEDAESLNLRVGERTELADWQRTHAGHLSILLSAPELIIYASPIVHLRALHAIRQALKREGLLIFEFESSDEFIDYLNNPKVDQYQPPQRFLEIFLSSGIPLAPDHHVERKNNGWILTNYGDEFRLNERDYYIYVSYLIPDELVAAFSDLINFTGFSFMPDNHHSHWHVDYGADNLDRFKDLWLSMRVDLEGFNDYLSTYRVNANLKSVYEEWEKIRDWCDAYVKEFEQRYGRPGGTPDDEQLQKITISNALLNAIFGVYKDSNSPFIKPAVIIKNVSQSNQVNVQGLASDELEDQIKFSGQLLFGREGLVEQLFIRGMLNKRELYLVKWRVHFVREHEPLYLRRLIEEAVDEPELEDYEPEMWIA